MNLWGKLTTRFDPLILILLMGIVHTSCVHNEHRSKAQLKTAKTIKYSIHIKPILQKYCIECHGVEGTESELDLRTLESILKGGESGLSIIKNKPNESLLLKQIEDQIMPPEGAPLTKKHIKKIRLWILSGASS
jgi:hypothetical protein